MAYKSTFTFLKLVILYLIDHRASPGPAGPICNNYRPTQVAAVPVPDGCVNGDGYRCNWCNCHVDDTVSIELLAKYMEDRFCIDVSREYIAGFSQGGMMTHTVACEMADRFAAAAPFHGARHMGFDCNPPDGVTMPIFAVWFVLCAPLNTVSVCGPLGLCHSSFASCRNQRGRDDTTVPGEAVLSGTFPLHLHQPKKAKDVDGPGYYFIPRQNVIERFAEHNGCDIGKGIERVEVSSSGDKYIGEYGNWEC